MNEDTPFIDGEAYPTNVVALLTDKFRELLGTDFNVINRPLRPSDPSRSVGIYAVDWRPQDNSHEMGGGFDPTVSSYQYRVQNLVKHADEVEGRVLYARDSKMIRAVLYRDQDLRVRLHQLNETTLGMLERTQRYGVRTQRFLNNEVSGTFLFLSTAEFWVETETVPAP